MKIVETSKASAIIEKLVTRGAAGTSKVEAATAKIVKDVQRGGDRALQKYASKLDGLGARQGLRVPREEMHRAWDESPEPFRRALRAAANNIRMFARWQMPETRTAVVDRGFEIGQIVRPLASVGCYVPGGRFPLPSTMLMTVIPAQVAGVKRIVVVSPKPARETLAAAAMLGVEEFYRVGGAQAIAALAYGTASVPRVDKIVGPGNLYVTTAKKLVAFDCSIDMLAGPTEALIYSDAGDARFIAADLVAQAEHDPETTCVFITTQRALAEAVAAQTEKQSKGNKNAEQSLKHNGAILLASSRDEALRIANRIAPEHITVDKDVVAQVQHAGSLFVGDYSTQPVGDYCSGPNHVLPTGAAARWRGGLSVLDFVKVITVQELSVDGLRSVGETAVTLAEAEGLEAHANAVRVRLGWTKPAAPRVAPPKAAAKPAPAGKVKAVKKVKPAAKKSARRANA